MSLNAEVTQVLHFRRCEISTTCFYGVEPNVSIATYAYNVLLPILIKNKQSYLATLHGNTKLKSKRRLGISYHRGWILGVEKV